MIDPSLITRKMSLILEDLAAMTGYLNCLESST